MIMKPPPPMPQENGSTTPSTAAVATAASTALPPSRRTRMPAAVARRLTEATAPPVPTATGCLTRLSEAATAGAAIAPGTRAPIPRNAAISGAVMRLFTVSLPKAHPTLPQAYGLANGYEGGSWCLGGRPAAVLLYGLSTDRKGMTENSQE